ncbi:MAG TPA: hypothetical protein VNN10_12675 [Dehalococcoidia bacterium]|nr:hypothetical protein [Dehalococcoidia bacterium]
MSESPGDAVTWRRPAPGAPGGPGQAEAGGAGQDQPKAATVAAVSYRGSPLPREWLIAAASAVMGAVLGVAVYSMAVGSGDAAVPGAFGGPGGPRPQQPAGQGFQPPGPAPGAPGLPQQGGIGANLLPRAPDFSGQVRTLVGASLTVDTPQGSRVVQVTADTRILRPDGSAGSRADLARGALVAVVTTNDPVTRELRAEAIGILR